MIQNTYQLMLNLHSNKVALQESLLSQYLEYLKPKFGPMMEASDLDQYLADQADIHLDMHLRLSGQLSEQLALSREHLDALHEAICIIKLAKLKK